MLDHTIADGQVQYDTHADHAVSSAPTVARTNTESAGTACAGGGQAAGATQCGHAAPTPLAAGEGPWIRDTPQIDADASGDPIVSGGGQKSADAQSCYAPTTDDPIGGGGQTSRATHPRAAASPDTIAEIREQWRRRQAWHRAEKALTLQVKAICRRLAGGEIKDADKLYRAAIKGDDAHPLATTALAAIFPLVEARDGMEKHRKAVERRLAKIAKTLPVAPWIESVRGVGIASLAAVVGECGDLSEYDNPAKVWKRMGLAVMGDGTRQRRIGGAEAMEHGYSPSRRSIAWNIGECIVKAGGPYKELYDARKVYEAERVETKAHAHNRAKRYVEKRVLRDLWRAWRSGEADRLAVPDEALPPHQDTGLAPEAGGQSLRDTHPAGAASQPTPPA